jgi:hypothetical protein
MFPTGDLLRMQAAQLLHMPDTCHRAAHSSTKNDYGEMVSSWEESMTDIPCGIEQGSGRISEEVEKDKTIVTYDAIARLPISQAEVWNIKDRLIVTKRFGTAITPITYDVAAPVRRGPSGIRLVLKKVEV